MTQEWSLTSTRTENCSYSVKVLSLTEQYVSCLQAVPPCSCAPAEKFLFMLVKHFYNKQSGARPVRRQLHYLQAPLLCGTHETGEGSSSPGTAPAVAVGWTRKQASFLNLSYNVLHIIKTLQYKPELCLTHKWQTSSMQTFYTNSCALCAITKLFWGNKNNPFSIVEEPDDHFFPLMAINKKTLKEDTRSN